MIHRRWTAACLAIASILTMLLTIGESSCYVPSRYSSGNGRISCNVRYLWFLSTSLRDNPHLFWKEFSKMLSSTSSGHHEPVSSSPLPPCAINARPTPTMPSQLFQQLAQSQLELLASSLTTTVVEGIPTTSTTTEEEHRKPNQIVSKIKSMALYLPQENALTGQLEFLPVVLFPDPKSDRVFIASDSDSGLAPALPKTLTKLPGFAVAESLFPGYPMMSSSGTQVGVGVVEEVFCHVPNGRRRSGGAALSVPLLTGSQTVGVLLVSPRAELSCNSEKDVDNDDDEGFLLPASVWTETDREQVARAAKSLSLALSMDTERVALQRQNKYVKEALSDSLHQLKNPLQALRTYGKLLQQRIADSESVSSSSMISASSSAAAHHRAQPQLLELADHLMIQSDRLSQRLKPVDWIVDSLDEPQAPRPPLLLLRPAEERSLVRWKASGADAEEPNRSFARANPMIDPASDQTAKSTSDISWPNTLKTSEDEESYDPGTNSKRLYSGPASVGNQRPPNWLMLYPPQDVEMSFLEDVLEPVISAFRAIAEDRRIEFDVDMSDDVPGVTVSTQAVQEAASNLLDNAFNYVVAVADHPVKPRVRVRIRPNPSPQVSAGATILVEDNGPGIPDAEVGSVLRRGFRGESAKVSGAAGSGLGLGIARALVEGVGGTLRVLTRSEASRLGCLPGAAMEVVLFRDPPQFQNV